MRARAAKTALAALHFEPVGNAPPVDARGQANAVRSIAAETRRLRAAAAVQRHCGLDAG